jgi:hypothetical protein
MNQVAAASSARSAGEYDVVDDHESDRAPVLAEALVTAGTATSNGGSDSHQRAGALCRLVSSR